MPTNLFFSYSHCDEALRDELEKHLASLKQQGVIATWHDRKIVAGKRFNPEISENLETADIILLLVSHSFLASNSCKKEMFRAKEKYDNGEAHVIPVILRPCDWHDMPCDQRGTPLRELLAVPQDGKSVTSHPDQNAAFLEVVQEIKKAVQKISERKPDANAGAREVLDVSGVEYPFRWCPAGTFMMGNSTPEEEWMKNETPQHRVTLTQDFMMLETPVTQAMWKSVIEINPSYYKGSEKLPVESVSWDDCQQYIAK